MADRLANEARANMGPRAKAYIEECRVRTGVLQQTADALAAAMPVLHQLPRVPKPARTARIPTSSCHEWVWAQNQWMCVTCGRSCRCRNRKIMGSPCLGFPAYADIDLSHRCYRGFVGHLPLVFCRACGAHSTARKGKLLQQCRPRPSTIVTRLRRGVHPATRAPLIGVQPLGRLVRRTHALQSQLAQSRQGHDTQTEARDESSSAEPPPLPWDEAALAAAFHAMEPEDFEDEWQEDFLVACQLGVHGGL
jgi:hypothetical protein